MEPMDYLDPACCFDASRYRSHDELPPQTGSIPTREVISRLDEYFAHNDLAGAGEHLRTWRKKAQELGDWAGELSLLSELIGYYRRTGDKDRGLEAVGDAFRLIGERGIGRSVSAATVMLNGATTMNAFGLAEKSLPVYQEVFRVYGENLDPRDYRFAGLLNNMALAYVDVGAFDHAEAHYKKALDILKKLPNNLNEIAVTWVNMAHMYHEQDPQDERVGACMDAALETLNDPAIPRDGYYAFTCTKCASSFSYFGYFLAAKELSDRAEDIYAGA